MTGANSIRKPKDVLKIDWINFDKVIDVKTYTLDDIILFYYYENKKIDFIWCDIQGAEYDMIQGAKKSIDNIGLMLLEYSVEELYEGQKGINDIMQLLGSDWEIVFKSPFDILVRNKKYKNG